MAYTVKQVASLAGISVRTLHHYDQIGLFKPSYIKNNGYRYYNESKLIILQQILFFKELEFDLQEIKRIVSSPGFDVGEALKDQKRLLKSQIDRLNGLLHTIDKTINTMKKDKFVEAHELFGNMSKEEAENIKKEVKEKYGDSYNQKTKDWEMSKYKEVFKTGEIILINISKMIDAGAKPEDQKIQVEVEKYFHYINNFWDCNVEAFKNLGQMYVDDERFTKNMNKIKAGLALFMRDAMAYYSQRK